jgi:hypothetical protein
VEYESLTYPPYDAPLAEAYGGRFESVYIILHPFVSVPEELSWKATKTYPGDGVILSKTGKFKWSSMATQTGLQTCAKLNQALLTSIRSIDNELCDFEASSALQTALTSGSVWMPTEGRFEPLLRADFLHAFEFAGKERLIHVPESPRDEPVEEFDIARLRSGEEPFPNRGSLVAPDGSFLFTVDWDSFFTLFYGPREFVSEVVRRRELEGFFANPKTDHFWFNYSMGCCVVTLSPEDWPAV